MYRRHPPAVDSARGVCTVDHRVNNVGHQNGASSAANADNNDNGGGLDLRRNCFTQAFMDAAVNLRYQQWQVRSVLKQSAILGIIFSVFDLVTGTEGELGDGDPVVFLAMAFRFWLPVVASLLAIVLLSRGARLEGRGRMRQRTRPSLHAP
jgi:hypothetical protein